MRRPSRTTRALGAAGIGAVLVGAIAVFSTIGSAETTAAAQQYAPQNTSPPTISGVARDGSTLTASPGRWNGSPTTFRYQFRSCNASGSGCDDIPGATLRTYAARSADVGRRLKVRVTASNSSGSSNVESNLTAVVAAAQAPPPTGSTIPAAAVVLPNRLVIDRVSFSPSPIRSRDPFTARFRVTDTRGVPVTGALVYAAGIPFSRIVQPGEVQTDAQGFATMTIQPTRLLPLRNGFLLTMFVRARKAGDDLLAGVSTRRLVSIRTANPS